LLRHPRLKRLRTVRTLSSCTGCGSWETPPATAAPVCSSVNRHRAFEASVQFWNSFMRRPKNRPVRALSGTGGMPSVSRNPAGSPGHSARRMTSGSAEATAAVLPLLGRPLTVSSKLEEALALAGDLVLALTRGPAPDQGRRVRRAIRGHCVPVRRTAAQPAATCRQRASCAARRPACPPPRASRRRPRGGPALPAAFRGAPGPAA